MSKKMTPAQLVKMREHSIMMLNEYSELINIIGGNEESLIRSMFLGFIAESINATRVTFYYYDNMNKIIPNFTMTYKNKKLIPYDYYSELKNVTIEVGKDICGIVTKTKKALFIPDISKDKRYKGTVDKKIKHKTNSIIAIPLIIDNNVFGIIEVANSIKDRRFSISDYFIASIITRLTMLTMEKTKLYNWSVTDNLTQVYNFQFLQISLDKELTRSKRYPQNIALVLIDIDNFKQINDQFGHLFGNVVLKGVANVIRRTIRKDVDLPVRYGGDEFLIILPETDVQGCQILAKRLLDNMRAEKFTTDDNVKVSATISVGVTSAKKNQIIDKEKLIKRADKALYTAKSRGKNCFVFIE
ncbi:MAG: sensor domain-containing diguanylate cyclase [bacterium]|nr:sensor domain-containing diguanylate cyclase [bacterium]